MSGPPVCGAKEPFNEYYCRRHATDRLVARPPEGAIQTHTLCAYHASTTADSFRQMGWSVTRERIAA